MKDGELSQQLDESSFTEGIVDTGVTSDGRGGEREVFDPSSLPSAAEQVKPNKPGCDMVRCQAKNQGVQANTLPNGTPGTQLN